MALPPILIFPPCTFFLSSCTELVSSDHYLRWVIALNLEFSQKSIRYKKSRKENPQKLTQLSSRSHPRHLVGKRTAQKDTIIDITSDSQVNSNFPYRWSPASLTFNNYFYLFLYLYITWITINNSAPHLKSPKNQNRRAALGRPAIKITGGLQLVCGRPTLALSSALVPQILSCLVCVEDS